MKQDMQNRTISELYTDDKKSKCFSNTNDILKLDKNVMKNFIQRRQRLKLPLLNFLVNFLTERKSQMSNFTIARQTFFYRKL